MYLVRYDVFTSLELDYIIELGEQEGLANATVGAGNGTHAVSEYARLSKVSWIGRERKTDWLFKRLIDTIISTSPADTFLVDYQGLVGKLQYTVYDQQGSHYGWHTDDGQNHRVKYPDRKISISVMLNDPTEYSGGLLQLNLQPEEVTITPGRGAVVIFPSYIVHRVTPVEHGVRKSLVMWSR